MKISILRSIVLFAAGAGCASVVAQVNHRLEPIKLGVYQENLNDLLKKVALAGQYVVLAEKGRVVIDPNGCPMPVPNPKMPGHAVDPRTLYLGVQAMLAYNEGNLVGDLEPIQDDGRCQTQ